MLEQNLLLGLCYVLLNHAAAIAYEAQLLLDGSVHSTFTEHHQMYGGE